MSFVTPSLQRLVRTIRDCSPKSAARRSWAGFVADYQEGLKRARAEDPACSLAQLQLRAEIFVWEGHFGWMEVLGWLVGADFFDADTDRVIGPYELNGLAAEKKEELEGLESGLDGDGADCDEEQLVRKRK
jgi:hypothetical protein